MRLSAQPQQEAKEAMERHRLEVRLGVLTQSRKLLTYFLSFGAFAALAKAFAGDELGQNPRRCGLNSGLATSY